jgi:hypothetical protein
MVAKPLMIDSRSEVPAYQSVGHPLSVATRNEYLNTIMSFTRWAKKRRKIEHDPLESLTQADESRA